MLKAWKCAVHHTSNMNLLDSVFEGQYDKILPVLGLYKEENGTCYDVNVESITSQLKASQKLFPILRIKQQLSVEPTMPGEHWSYPLVQLHLTVFQAPQPHQTPFPFLYTCPTSGPWHGVPPTGMLSSSSCR